MHNGTGCHICDVVRRRELKRIRIEALSWTSALTRGSSMGTVSPAHDGRYKAQLVAMLRTTRCPSALFSGRAARPLQL